MQLAVIFLQGLWAVLSLLACAALALFSLSDVHAATATEVFRTAAPSVVVVEAEGPSGSSLGSGVVFDKEPGFGTWVATNHHVVSRASRVTVRFAGRTYPAKKLVEDVELDLCLLTVEALGAPVAKARSAPALAIGEPVYAIGTPQGLELSLSDGVVSQFREHPSTYQLIQTTAPISRGSSGGGLFDREGRLIGLTTFFLRESQNLNFAIPVSAIEDVRHALFVVVYMSVLANPSLSSVAGNPGQTAGFSSALDQAVPGWRRDLESNSFRRWLGLVRDAKGQRRNGDIGDMTLLESTRKSWQPAVELFRDYRASSFYRAEQRAQEQPRAATGAPRWQQVGRTKKFILYSDPTRIRRQGSRLIVWSLIDYADPQTYDRSSIRSVLRAHEIECDTVRSATRQQTNFGGQMGSGEVIDTNHDGNAQLEFAQPGSPIEMLIAWACGEK